MLVIRGRRVVLRDVEQPASIHIDSGRIAAVRGYDDVHSGAEVVDAGRLVISPGIVDTHVHINEPGRTDWEGFATATRAAAAGGVTTVVDMPLNAVPPTTTVAALQEKRRAAAGQACVDVAFWGGIVPGNTADLEPLVDAGVRGFKCFLVPSGVDEFPAVGEDDLRAALPILTRRGVPLLVHAESPARISPFGSHDADSRNSYPAFLSSRPPAAEVEAVRLIVALAAEYGARVHIVHVAAADAADEIAGAKARGVAITAESCPHYLTFAAGEIATDATLFKCTPPIREACHRDRLWDALRSGTLDLVATDHSPSPPHMKCGRDLASAWGGIASLELSLAATWTGASARGFSPVDVARWLSAAPARLAGLNERKGVIAEGCDADLTIWDPDAEFVVDASRLQQRHKITPYAGRRLRGRVQSTFVRGRRVWTAGELSQPATGQLL